MSDHGKVCITSCHQFQKLIGEETKATMAIITTDNHVNFSNKNDQHYIPIANVIYPRLFFVIFFSILVILKSSFLPYI